MTAATIRADGLDWPLDTYLDARGFRRLTSWELPRLDPDARVETVTRTGEFAPVRYAGSVRWQDVLAYLPLEGTPAAWECRCCGGFAGGIDDDLCEDCADAVEPGLVF